MSEAAHAPHVVAVPEGTAITVAATETSAGVDAAVEIAEIQADVELARIETDAETERLRMQNYAAERDAGNTPGGSPWQDDRDVLQAQLDTLRQGLEQVRASQLLSSEVAILATQSTPVLPLEEAPEPMTTPVEAKPEALSEAPAGPPDRERKRLRRL